MKHYKNYLKILLVIPLLLTFFYSCDDKEDLQSIVNPNAKFTYKISSENPLAINFTSTITDRDSWQWDFGDGATSNLAHPTHTYAEEGNYTVTLTAFGETGSTPHKVEQDITVILFEPTATFTFSSGTDNPLEVKFTAITEYATAYSWNFGDGSNSTKKNPVHEYAVRGDYDVTLTVTGYPGTTPVTVTETVTAGIELVKVQGTIIGHASSWGDNPDTYVSAAFDGNLSTFVDAPEAEGYAGYDFGETATISLIKYAPRDGFTGRMVNGEFRGSNDSDYLNTYDVIHTITDEPTSGVLTEIGVTVSYRYIYFYSTDYCNVSELEFFGSKVFVAVDLDNTDFSLPGTGKQTNWDNVPGWNTDTQAADSGIENQEGDGNWFAYRMSSDPQVYQLSEHTIASGEQFKVNVQAWDTWNSSQFTLTIYYDTGDGSRNVLATQTFDITGDRTTLELVGTANGASVGAKLGVTFESVSTDGGDGWSGFDNVELFVK